MTQGVAISLTRSEDATARRLRSKGLTVPKPERIRFVGYSMSDVAIAVFQDLPDFWANQLRWGLTRWKDGMWWILDTNIRARVEWEVV